MERRQPHFGTSHSGSHLLEFLELYGRKRLVWLVRGGEMREHAGKAKVRIARYPDR
jgi:hypothetical protein